MPSTFSKTANCGSASLSVASMAKNGRAFRSRNSRLPLCKVEKGVQGKPQT
jgi:hypothetical protein